MTFRTTGMSIGLAAAMLLAGCSRTHSGADGSTQPSATKHTVTVLLAAEAAGHWPTGLDPATNATAGANISIMNAIFGGLFQLMADDDGGHPRIVPVLAAGAEITEGGKALIIHLREGVRFSDGSPLNAEAIRFNIERSIKAPCGCAPTRWPWAEPRVSLVDEHTVSLNFRQTYAAAALNAFPTMNINWIASPTAVKTMSEADFKMKPVGAGPFRVVNNELSTKLVLERNPRYWQPGRPYLDRLVFVSIGNEQSAYQSLLSGGAQIAEGITATQLIAQAQKENKIVVTPQPGTSPYIVQLNTAAPPFDNRKAREAIYYATDGQPINQGVFNGVNGPSQMFTASGGLFHHAQVPGYREYDLARARALAKEIGGLKVTLSTLRNGAAEQVITALQTQWQQAGIEVTLETYELGRLVESFRSGKWQAMLQTAGSYDPESGAGVSFRFASREPFTGVHDKELDRMLLNAATTVDPTERDAMYLQTGKYISDNAYAPFLFAFAPTQFSVRGITGPGLTTRIPPMMINTGIIWQEVRMVN